MGDVIRLVCPECDAVHRVKSVTLGKLYRCKKCRSGLITMQPAILVCPNCGATTPPTHIEASKLITCEECEKAPLMEVRLPGIEYPKSVSSHENAEIASKMSISAAAENSDEDNDESSVDSESSFTSEYNSEVTQTVIETSFEDSSEEIRNSDELDETKIFKADTNFIVKNFASAEDGATEEAVEEVAEDDRDSVSLQQLNIFKNGYDEVSDTSEEIHDEFDSEIYEIMPEIEAVSHNQSGSPEEVIDDNNTNSEGFTSTEFRSDISVDNSKKGVSGWSMPAWVPAVFALLLVGLYGVLYADLQSMRVQLEKSQESIIAQDLSFQQERKKYLSLIKSTQAENRKLRDEVMDLKSENNILRKKSISLEIPEIED